MKHSLITSFTLFLIATFNMTALGQSANIISINIRNIDNNGEACAAVDYTFELIGFAGKAIEFRTQVIDYSTLYTSTSSSITADWAERYTVQSDGTYTLSFVYNESAMSPHKEDHIPYSLRAFITSSDVKTADGGKFVSEYLQTNYAVQHISNGYCTYRVKSVDVDKFAAVCSNYREDKSKSERMYAKGTNSSTAYTTNTASRNTNNTSNGNSNSPTSDNNECGGDGLGFIILIILIGAFFSGGSKSKTKKKKKSYDYAADSRRRWEKEQYDYVAAWYDKKQQEENHRFICGD